MTDNFRSVEQEAHVATTEESLDRLRDEVAQLRASRLRLALAADAERRSIERELHDVLQQRLVAVAVTLQLARGLVDAESEGARALLDELAEDVQRAMDDAAALALRVYPPLLEAGGLGAALRASAAAAGRATSIDVESSVPLRPESAAAVYFSCAELLAAVQARAVAVYEEDGAAVFDVAYDGELGEVGSDALLHARDRLEALGGQVVSDSGPDESSRLRGSLPLHGRE